MSLSQIPSLIDPGKLQTMDDRLMPVDGVQSDAVIAQPFYPLDSSPDPTAERLSQLLYGEPVKIISESGTWCKVHALIDGYVGWLPKQVLSETSFQATHRVIMPLTHTYLQPDIKSRAIVALPMNAFVTLTGEISDDGKFAQMTSRRWALVNHLTAIDSFENDPFMVALRFMNVPYQWGGRTCLGLDCSALIQLAMFACGKRVMRDSDLQMLSLGVSVKQDDLKQGDLVFFPGHVGIMADDSNILHANAKHMAVTIDPLNDVLDWVERDTGKQSFSGARRLS